MSAKSDTVTFSDGHALSCTVLQTNGDDLLLLLPHGAFNYSKSRVKEISLEDFKDPFSSGSERLANFKQAALLLSKELWATNLTQIPATVIDKGVLRNVPYASFRCGTDYEINIYGDLDHPAGIEVGLCRKLLANETAQDNCLQFIGEVLANEADKEVLHRLNREKDLKMRDNLTFEVTPPSSDDSYNGWWVSVYSESLLYTARASDEEMKQISVPTANAGRQSSQSGPSWSSEDLKLSRPSGPITISFTLNSGDVISNAQVRIYREGVSVIWETKTGGMGLVKMEDLPEPLRSRFGYDPIKTETAIRLEKERGEQQQRDLSARSSAQAAQQSSNATVSSPKYSTVSGGIGYSTGGSVYVHGYTRSNGTYVSGYTRRSP
jgi:hypothetical protein